MTAGCEEVEPEVPGPSSEVCQMVDEEGDSQDGSFFSATPSISSLYKCITDWLESASAGAHGVWRVDKSSSG